MNIFQYMIDEYCGKDNFDNNFHPTIPKYTDEVEKRKSLQEIAFDKYNANIPIEDTDLEDNLDGRYDLRTAFPDEKFSPKTSKEFLKKCIEVQDERASEYEQDGAERSFNKVAIAFNAITGKDVTAAEISLILQILKDVRAWSTESLHMDSLIDGISYASLKAELLVEHHRNK